MFENVHFEALGSLFNILNPNSTPVSIPSYKQTWSKANLDKELSFFEKIFCNLLVKTIFFTGKHSLLILRFTNNQKLSI